MIPRTTRELMKKRESTTQKNSNEKPYLWSLSTKSELDELNHSYNQTAIGPKIVDNIHFLYGVMNNITNKRSWPRQKFGVR